MATLWIEVLLVSTAHCLVGAMLALGAARRYASRWHVEGRGPSAVHVVTYRSAALRKSWVSRLPRALVGYVGLTSSAASTLVWPAMLMSADAPRLVSRGYLGELDVLFALVAFAVMLALGVTGVFALRLIARVEDPDANARLACVVAWATALLFIGVVCLTGWWSLLLVSALLAIAGTSLAQAMACAQEAERGMLADDARALSRPLPG